MLNFLTVAAALCVGQPAGRLDRAGDPLPEYAIARLGTLRLRHGSNVCGVSFSHDEKTLFSAGHDNAVRQWDVATGKLVRELQGDIGHDFCFRAMALSPNGELLAAAGGSADCRVYFWDAVSGKRLEVIKGEEVIHGLAFSPDSKTLAWITLENRLVFWDRAAKTKKTIHIPTIRMSHCLAYSPDGKQLAIGDDGGVIRLIDAASGKFIRHWQSQGESPNVERICYSPDGTMLATCGGLYAPIQLCDAKTGKALQSLKLEWQLDYSVAFSPDGTTLVSQHDSDLILWDTATGKRRRTIVLPEPDYARDFAFTRDGKSLAIAHDGGGVSLIDLDTGKPRFLLEAHRRGLGPAIFLKGEHSIASGVNGKIRFWDAATGVQTRDLSLGKKWPYCFALAPDGQSLLWGGSQNAIRIVRLDTLEETKVLEGHSVNVSSLHVFANGKRLLSHAGTVVKLWDLSTGTCLVTKDFEYSVGAVAVMPDGKRFLAAYGGTVSVCDAETLKPLEKFENSGETPTALLLSADGKRLASRAWGLDDSIRLWDVEARRQVFAFDVKDGVGALAMTSDGRRLAYTSYEPEITIWDIAARKAVRTLKGHVGPMRSLTFSSDGARLLSAGSDSTLVVWDVAMKD